MDKRRDKSLPFEERIIDAARQISEGDPLKDFLNDREISEAICRLADVYTAVGFKVPEID